MFLRWKKSPARKDGDITWYAELVESRRVVGKGPRQVVVAYLGSIRGRLLAGRDRKAFSEFLDGAKRRGASLAGSDWKAIEEKLSRKPARAKRPRDSQRSRLYKAERTVPAGHYRPKLAECQEYVNQVLRSRFWKVRYPEVTRVEVKDGRGSRRGRAITKRERLFIALPRWARSERVILHELAHHATPRCYAAHGPEYAAIYLELVSHFMGNDVGEKLAHAFDAHRVKRGICGEPGLRDASLTGPEDSALQEDSERRAGFSESRYSTS